MSYTMFLLRADGQVPTLLPWEFRLAQTSFPGLPRLASADYILPDDKPLTINRCDISQGFAALKEFGHFNLTITAHRQNTPYRQGPERLPETFRLV